MINSTLFDLEKSQTSNMHKVKGDLKNLAYEQYDMLNAKATSKCYNMYNNYMKYAFKS